MWGEQIAKVVIFNKTKSPNQHVFTGSYPNVCDAATHCSSAGPALLFSASNSVPIAVVQPRKSRRWSKQDPKKKCPSESIEPPR